MKLYLVRHGQSEGNFRKVYCGVNDVELTKEGVLQAQRMAKKFEGRSISKIYSSPLKRAYNTALEISNVLKLDIEKSDLLKEINFGIFENLTWNDIKTRFPNEAQKWADVGVHYKFVDGESLDDVVVRVIEFVKNCCDNSIIVTHSGIIQSFIIALEIASYENSWDYVINNCDVICIENGKITYFK
ncbi:histidine phosphatase family protein [Sedimentibacter sp. zth1]|uniref:histidine phosphatase family protein n=1 Tax=Sedimentibacter sp. zth1 TaxID=2816908 RepID=UPI001A931F3E|nr:histidine phosphatase family protein [Sedimentibacter sp. zth1]QSX06601.1 histidine phosphatase family protein [Sedimentibacter sp. zth1]